MLNRDRITELFRDDDDSQNRRKSILITAILVCGACVVFTIFGFTTKLPLPAEEGSFVLLGLEPEGEVIDKPQPVQPTTEPVQEEQTETQPEPVPETTEQAAETPLETSTDQDAPEINASEETEPTESQSDQSTEPIEQEQQVEPVEQEQPAESQESQLAKEFEDLMNNSEPAKGEPEGDSREIGENAIKFNFETNFGSVGIVGGSGRGGVDMGDIDDLTQENGDVYIKVTVDRDGNVVEARNDVSRTTTPSSVLIDKAIAAAKASKFEKVSGGPLFTEEILYFKYRLE